MINLFKSTRECLDRLDEWQYDEKTTKIELDNKKRLRYKLESGQITFDWNGHHKSRLTKPKVPKEYNWSFRRDFGHEEEVVNKLMSKVLGDSLPGQLTRARRLKRLLDEPGKRFYKLNDTCSLDYCFECGRNYTLGFDGRTIKFLNTCKYPTGHPPIDIKIKIFSSGKITFANGFRTMQNPDDNDFYRRGFNGIIQDVARMKHYEKQNIAYGFCGNTCPGIYINKKQDKLIVGNLRHDSDYNRVGSFRGYERCGSVITDLWAWTACDQDLLINRGEKLESRCYDTINVKPGIYKVTNNFFCIDNDANKNLKYATLQRIK